MLTHRLMGRQISAVGLGTADFGGKIGKERAFDVLDAYADAGGNLIDTARVYGDFSTPRDGESEKIIGRWMEERKNRDRLFLSTKGGHPRLASMGISRLSREEIADDLKRSLEDLRCSKIDCYFLHRDDEALEAGRLVDILEGFLSDGLIASYGVSNWKTYRILEARRYAEAHGLTGIGINQPQFSLLRPAGLGDPTLVRMDRDMLETHRRLSMPCFCFSSQANGVLSLMAAGKKMPAAREKRYDTPENRAIAAKAKDISDRTGLDANMIAMAFITCQAFPCFALCGTSDPDRARSWGRIGNAALDAETVEALNSMTLGPGSKGEWSL